MLSIIESFLVVLLLFFALDNSCLNLLFKSKASASFGMHGFL